MNKRQKPNQQMLDAMHKNPSNWRGVLYVNRKDPRLFVPKIYPMTGWTINFANPYSYITILGIILIIVIVNSLTS